MFLIRKSSHLSQSLKKLNMKEGRSIRIDKFLWSVRIYKTRSMASEACRKGRVIINDNPVKPSRQVFKDEVILVKMLPVSYTYRVIEPVEKRVSARLVSDYIEDLTHSDEKMKLGISNYSFSGFRKKGSGRPTKKERRNLDRLINNLDR